MTPLEYNVLKTVDELWRSANNIIAHSSELHRASRLEVISALHYLVSVGKIESRLVGTTRQYRRRK